MAIESICSGCGRSLSVGNEHVGKQARCPNCGQIYTVPHFVSPQALPGNPATPSTGTATQPFLSADSEQSGQPVGDIASPDAAPLESQQSSEQFWMRGADGIEYGPADRAKLNRWFAEGRVGADYQIKHNANGIWQSAQIFRPSSTGPAQSSNPFAASNPFAETQSPYAAPQSTQTAAGFQKSDPSTLVLTMGIVAWLLFFACPLLSLIPGIVAWVTGRNALQDIQAGLADGSNVGLVKTGYYLGMVQVLLFILLVVFGVGFVAVTIVLDSM